MPRPGAARLGIVWLVLHGLHSETTLPQGHTIEHTSVKTGFTAAPVVTFVKQIARRLGAARMGTVWRKQTENQKGITALQPATIQRAFAKRAGRVRLVGTLAQVLVPVPAMHVVVARLLLRPLLLFPITLTLTWLAHSRLPCLRLARISGSARGIAAASNSPPLPRARTLLQ